MTSKKPYLIIMIEIATQSLCVLMQTTRMAIENQADRQYTPLGSVAGQRLMSLALALAVSQKDNATLRTELNELLLVLRGTKFIPRLYSEYKKKTFYGEGLTGLEREFWQAIYVLGNTSSEYNLYQVPGHENLIRHLFLIAHYIVHMPEIIEDSSVLGRTNTAAALKQRMSLENVSKWLSEYACWLGSQNYQEGNWLCPGFRLCKKNRHVS
jgi:hypothetical protein